jgi:Helix-turn-helix
MLPAALVNEIDRLVHEGNLSQRKIAAHVGVSRGTVSAIANGRRGLYGKEPPDVHAPRTASLSPMRCPDCGYRVYLPCLICSARRHTEIQILLRVFAAAESAGAGKRAADLQRSTNLSGIGKAE